MPITILQQSSLHNIDYNNDGKNDKKLQHNEVILGRRYNVSSNEKVFVISPNHRPVSLLALPSPPPPPPPPPSSLLMRDMTQLKLRDNDDNTSNGKVANAHRHNIIKTHDNSSEVSKNLKNDEKSANEADIFVMASSSNTNVQQQQQQNETLRMVDNKIIHLRQSQDYNSQQTEGNQLFNRANFRNYSHSHELPLPHSNINLNYFSATRGNNEMVKQLPYYPQITKRNLAQLYAKNYQDITTPSNLTNNSHNRAYQRWLQNTRLDSSKSPTQKSSSGSLPIFAPLSMLSLVTILSLLITLVTWCASIICPMNKNKKIMIIH